MRSVLSGPMFEPARHDGMKSTTDKAGAHYNIYYLDVAAAGRDDPEIGMESLRQLFPSGEPSDLGFVLFSTSGIHGTYTTIEDIEASLAKYGDDGPDDPETDDWTNTLTVLVVHPRIVCLRCGNVRVRQADIEWLKHLRDASARVCGQIGR